MDGHWFCGCCHSPNNPRGVFFLSFLASLSLHSYLLFHFFFQAIMHFFFFALLLLSLYLPLALDSSPCLWPKSNITKFCVCLVRKSSRTVKQVGDKIAVWKKISKKTKDDPHRLRGNLPSMKEENVTFPPHFACKHYNPKGCYLSIRICFLCFLLFQKYDLTHLLAIANVGIL